jgi:hypothetical protein
VGIVAGCSLSFLVHASDVDTDERQTEIPKPPAKETPIFTSVRSLFMGALPGSASLREPPVVFVSESPLVRAISQAKAKGVIARGVEGYTEVLIQCQKKQSVVHTTALLRSDAQRDHCYRF